MCFNHTKTLSTRTFTYRTKNSDSKRNRYLSPHVICGVLVSAITVKDNICRQVLAILSSPQFSKPTYSSCSQHDLKPGPYWWIHLESDRDNQIFHPFWCFWYRLKWPRRDCRSRDFLRFLYLCRAPSGYLSFSFFIRIVGSYVPYKNLCYFHTIVTPDYRLDRKQVLSKLFSQQV